MKRAATLSSMREVNDSELGSRLKRTEEELFQHRLKRHTNQLENTNLIRTAKRDIARAKTILARRKLGLEKGKE